MSGKPRGDYCVMCGQRIPTAPHGFITKGLVRYHCGTRETYAEQKRTGETLADLAARGWKCGRTGEAEP